MLYPIISLRILSNVRTEDFAINKVPYFQESHNNL
jgi:hypothetical protein